MASLNRIVMQEASFEMFKRLKTEKMDVAEISGKFGKRLKCNSYQQFHYPYFDICSGPIVDDDGKVLKYDLILANQVWEHLDRPYAATKNVKRMLKKGGYFWVAVPFYIPYHGDPVDCSRWSARGLKNLLIECGFAADEIGADQWGNRAAAARNLEPEWPPAYVRGQDDLTNDPQFPICSWALARKT